MYVVPFDELAVTPDADQDIFQLVAGSGSPCVLHAFSLTSTNTTDERARLRLVRRTTTGSGGSPEGVTTLPVALDDDLTMAALAVVSTLVTIPGTLSEVLKAWRWSQQNELLYLPTPELRPTIVAGGRLCLNLQALLGGARTWAGWVAWEEQ